MLAGSDTWSEACWEGIFQHVAILSIMSGLQPSSALAARPAPCQHLYLPHAALQRFWRWTDRPRAEALHASTLSGWGGCGEVLHGQKNVYHVGATVTNQRRLENMISLWEECEHTLLGCCALCKHSKAQWAREPRGARMHPLVRGLLDTVRNGEEEGVGYRWKETIANRFFVFLFWQEPYRGEGELLVRPYLSDLREVLLPSGIG